MRPRQMALALDGDDQRPIPLVYLACRLTNLSDDQRKLLDSWCTHVEQAVTDATGDSDKQWNVAVHIPFAWSAPWNDGRLPEAVYKLNSTTVITRRSQVQILPPPLRRSSPKSFIIFTEGCDKRGPRCRVARRWGVGLVSIPVCGWVGVIG